MGYELRVWKWEYTDASGNRCISRWLMTEHEATRYKDPVRLHHTLKVIYENHQDAVSWSISSLVRFTKPAGSSSCPPSARSAWS